MFVRKKSSILLPKKKKNQRGTLFDIEHRYESHNQIIQKKRIITGREYDTIHIDENLDEHLNQIRVLRTSFIYKDQYFSLETCYNLDGLPTFLRVESHDDNEIELPPFLDVTEDVT